MTSHKILWEFLILYGIKEF